MGVYGHEVTEFTKASKDPLNRLTKVDRVRKERVIEEKNRFEIMDAGQENLKAGIKAIESQEKERVKEEKQKADDALNALDMKKKFEKTYRMELAKALSEILEMLDWIHGWRAQVMVTNGSPISVTCAGTTRHFSTKPGLMTFVLTPDGRVFHRGILVTSDPALDYAALYTIALQVENTLDKEKGLLLDGSMDEPKAPQIPENAILDKNGNPISTTA